MSLKALSLTPVPAQAGPDADARSVGPRAFGELNSDVPAAWSIHAARHVFALQKAWCLKWTTRRTRRPMSRRRSTNASAWRMLRSGFIVGNYLAGRLLI